MYPPRDFRDGNDTVNHIAGTIPFCKELRALSSSSESRTSPLIAFLRFLRDETITLISPLNLSNS